MSSFHVGSVKGKDERSEKEQGDAPGESVLSPSLPAFLAESRTWMPSWNNLMVIRRQKTVRQTAEREIFVQWHWPLRTVLSWLARAW